MRASLSTAIKVPNQYLNSDRWVMQQKMDGWRVLVKTGEQTKCLNRDGDPLNEIPLSKLGIFAKMSTEWLFDCEYIDGEFYVFDVLEIPTGDIKNFPLRKRLELLDNLSEKFAPPIYKVPSFYGEDKLRVFQELKGGNKEGVIFKDLDAPYEEGRNKSTLKFKFTKHVDCIIIDRNIDDKDNFALGMFNGSEITEVGHCSALTGDGPKINIGDVVQVNILYATESGRLYQPVKPRIRIDKSPQDCTLDQLKDLLPDRTVVTL